jgi:hypothetical protein
MRALAAQGIADATALSAQLDNIQREAAAAAKAAATAREESEESATARAEDLAKRHAEALARLEFVASASNNAVSGEVQRSAKATLEAMQASQAKLMAAITSCRSQETEALQATIRSGNAEAKAAAAQLLENVQGLTQLHTLEMAALRDVARDTAELKQLMANMAATLGRVDQTTSDTLIGVKELMAMMQAMQAKLSAPNETPAQRKDKLVKALQACTVRVKVRAVCISPALVTEARPASARVLGWTACTALVMPIRSCRWRCNPCTGRLSWWLRRWSSFARSWACCRPPRPGRTSRWRR